jgi:predicted transcriptional regulator
VVPKKIGIEEVFFDEYSKLILNYLDDFRSVADIAENCKIPIVSAYRRIRKLDEMGLLETKGSIIQGVKLFMYRKSPLVRTDQEENPKTQKILQKIREKPGINYNELKKETKYSIGIINYNLVTLVESGSIRIERRYGRTWFFTSNTKDSEVDLIINLRKETSGRILSFLFISKSATFKEIQYNIKKSPATTSISLAQLDEIDLIRRTSGFPIRFELSDYEKTGQAIRKINLSVLDSLKDRFSDSFSYF